MILLWGAKLTTVFTGAVTPNCVGVLGFQRYRENEEQGVRMRVGNKKERGDGGYVGRCQWTAWVFLRLTCVFQTEQWHPNC